VHDYLAPMVKSATEGLETELERANRLARRYLAEYNEDKKTRIPLHHLLLIQRRADRGLIDTPAGRSLRRASVSYAARGVLVPPLTLVAAVLALCYVMLFASYYVSTGPANYKGGKPEILVRSGNPDLKYMPGFDNVLVDTGYSMADVDMELPDVLDVIPRERMRGFRLRTSYGYRDWVEHVLSQLNPLYRVRARRLLGALERSRDLAIEQIKAQGTNKIYFAWALGSVGKSPPASLSREFVKPIGQLLTPDVAEPVRLAAASAMGQIAQGRPDLEGPGAEIFHEVFTLFEKKLHDINARDPMRNLTWELRPYELAVISLATARPVSNCRDYADKIVEMRADPKVDAFAQWNVLRVAKSFGEANPEAAEIVIGGLLKVAFPEGGVERRADSAGWITIDALRTVYSLAAAVPAGVTKNSIAPLRNAIIMNTEGFDLRLMPWGDGSGVPTSGNNLVIVGIDNNGLLHVRIFDARGNRVKDTDQMKLPGTQARAISTLKQQLPDILPPQVLSSAEKAKVISEATSIVGQAYTDPDILARAALIYGLLGQSNPDAVQPDVIEVLKSTTRNEKASDFIKTSCALTLVRLGLARREWASAEAITLVRDFYKRRNEANDLYLQWASANVLGQVARANPGSPPGPDAHELVIDSIRLAFIDSRFPKVMTAFEEVNEADVISRFATGDHAAVGEDTVDLILECIENPKESSVPTSAAKALLALSKWAPDVVLKKRDRLYQMSGHGINQEDSSLTSLHSYFQAALARAHYEQERTRDRAKLVPTLLEWMKTGTDNDLRIFGSYGLFFLTIDEPETHDEVTKTLGTLRESKEPHVRMAANRALEMIRVGQCVVEGKSDRTSFARNRARVEFLLNQPEAHLSVAAQVALEEMVTPPN